MKNQMEIQKREGKKPSLKMAGWVPLGQLFIAVITTVSKLTAVTNTIVGAISKNRITKPNGYDNIFFGLKVKSFFMEI